MRPSRSALSIACILGLAFPLAAQETPPVVAAPQVVGEEEAAPDAGPSCGEYKAQWIGETAEASDITTAEAPLQQNLRVPSTEPFVLAFRVTGGTQALRLEAQPTEDGDPAIELLSSDGSLLQENDDFSESLASRIETSLEPGDYCLAARSVSKESIPVILQVGLASQAPLLTETGSTPLETCTPETEATALSEGPLEQAIASNLVQQNANGMVTSFFRFTLNEGTSLTLKADSAELDPQMALFSENGSKIAENDDAYNGTNAQLDFLTPLDPGSYCVAVAAFSLGESNISFSAEKLDRETFLKNAYKTGQMPPPLDGSYPVEEVNLVEEKQKILLSDGAANWLHFTLTKPTVMIIQAQASIAGGDPKLMLFNEVGQLQAENDDGENGLDAYLGPLLLQPGKYILAATDAQSTHQPGSPIRPIGLIFDRFERVE